MLITSTKSHGGKVTTLDFVKGETASSAVSYEATDWAFQKRNVAATELPAAAKWPDEDVLARLDAGLKRIVAACRSDATAVRAAERRASERLPDGSWQERNEPGSFDASFVDESCGGSPVLVKSERWTWIVASHGIVLRRLRSDGENGRGNEGEAAERGM